MGRGDLKMVLEKIAKIFVLEKLSANLIAWNQSQGRCSEMKVQKNKHFQAAVQQSVWLSTWLLRRLGGRESTCGSEPGDRRSPLISVSQQSVWCLLCNLNQLCLTFAVHGVELSSCSVAKDRKYFLHLINIWYDYYFLDPQARSLWGIIVVQPAW